MLVNKVDVETPGDMPAGGLRLSVKTGEGLETLLAKLEDHVVNAMGVRETPSLTRLRHRQALEEAANYLDRVLSGSGDMPELLAEDMRLAARALGRITGRVDVEDLLDVIFSDFCIGK